MNGWIAITVLGGLTWLGWLGILWDNACKRRHDRRMQPAEPVARPWTEPEPSPPAGPAEIVLTDDQAAALAALGLKYAGGDMRAGLEMASFLRRHQPELSPTAICRSIVLMRQIGCYFHRIAPDGERALIGLLEAMGGAAVALDLASLEQTEDIPS